MTQTTAEQVAQELDKAIGKIRQRGGKVYALITDNAPNLVAAAALVKGKALHARCLAHTIQLCITPLLQGDVVRTAINAAKTHPDWREPVITRWPTIHSLVSLQSVL